MEAIAKTKYLKGSPRKARLVIDMIRGVNVSRALSILKFTDKRAADPIAQCLSSAIANATYKAEQQNIAIDPDDLWIKTCFVDIGPTKGRKRMRPAPQGRAYQERRHYCHITIQVTSEEKVKTEQELKIAAAMATRPVGKKLAAKAAIKEAGKDTVKKAQAEKAETKKAKAEERETPIVNAPDDLVPTPVEPTAQAMMAAADEVSEPIVDETPVEAAETAAEVVEENKADIDQEVSAAHETSTHTTAEEHAAKPVDEVMEKTNEELERQ